MIEKMYKIKELGLKLVDFAYANKYMEMSEFNDLTEFKEEITNEFNDLFEVL